jgi:HEAT repeat protein
MFHPLNRKIDEMYERKDLKGLTKLLKSEDPDVRSMSARIIGTLFVEDQIPNSQRRVIVDSLIASALRDNDMYSLDDVCEALGKTGDERACDPLVHIIKEHPAPRDIPTYGMCVKAVEALGNIGDKDTVTFLISLLEDSEMVSYVIEALGCTGDRRAIDPLITMMEKKNFFYHKKAAQTLGKLGADKADIPAFPTITDKK